MSDRKKEKKSTNKDQKKVWHGDRRKKNWKRKTLSKNEMSEWQDWIMRCWHRSQKLSKDKDQNNINVWLWVPQGKKIKAVSTVCQKDISTVCPLAPKAGGQMSVMCVLSSFNWACLYGYVCADNYA